MPSSITFSDGSVIAYTDAADGTKLRTVHKIGSTTTTTDYCSNVIYENNTAKLLLTEEGYVSLNDNKYHYYLKDHQGNNRVVINQSGGVEKTNHYYPFGGVFAGTNSVQPYKYNGKEYDDRKGLNWYDYGARHYDAALGRWHVVDLLAEERYGYSVYVYVQNNPINRVDNTGMLDDWVEDVKKKIYWDPKAVSQETTKEGEIYLGKTVVVFNGSLNEKLGKGDNFFGEGAILANVTVYGPKGSDDVKQYKGYTMSSDSELFGVVANGIYDVNRISSQERKGPYKSEWTLNKRGRVPALNNYNPAYPKRNPGYLDGVFIHRSNNNGFAGKFWNNQKHKYSGVSEGCLLIAPNQWDNFNEQLNTIDKFRLQIIRE